MTWGSFTGLFVSRRVTKGSLYRAYGAIFLEFVKKMYKPIMYYINLGTWTITPSGWATNYTTEQNVEQLKSFEN